MMEHFNHRFMMESKLRDLEQENKTIREEKLKYEVDYKILLERYNELKRHSEQTDNDFNFFKQKQTEEVNGIEDKLEKMTRQMDILQRENNSMRSNEERLRQEVLNLEKQRDNYHEKYQDNKTKNNILNTKLAEVKLFLLNFSQIEDDFRKIVLEKQSEVYEKRREEESKKMKYDSKQKIIEDMQNRIANYKSELLKQRVKKDE